LHATRRDPRAARDGEPVSLLVGAIRLYQRTVSKMLPPACRFTPSCSEYAAQALERYGAMRGLKLAALRLLRCGPWHPGGIDPVP
jgi:putative membrane protein insertion efficiency factor